MVQEVRDVDKALAKTAAGFKASIKKRCAAHLPSQVRAPFQIERSGGQCDKGQGCEQKQKIVAPK